MPGPPPKDYTVRARRNKSSTRAQLSSDHDIKAPPLPGGIDWHPLTVRWWKDLWASPMAPEYAQMDINGMFRVALLMQDFWTAESPSQRAAIQLRLEKADADYGTNPLARRRLEWQIEATDKVKSAGRQRRRRDEAQEGGDPRLKLIK